MVVRSGDGGSTAEKVVGIRDALERCSRFGVKPGLDAISAACAEMGDPQDELRVIHVAGTNGKGAVCALVDSALRAAGFRTGRYTSPHIVALNERFFLDGAPATDEAIDSAFSAVCHPERLTYFELLTATAFELYRREKVDYLILETGLGGRCDATNVVKRPVVSVITRIGLDHCGWLGDTVGKIAAEKGGIIKPSVPVVLGAMPDEARETLERIAAERGSGCAYSPDILKSDVGGRQERMNAGLLAAMSRLALGGAFNRENAVTAFAALKTIGVSEEAIADGFASVVWPGRYQRVERGGKRFLVDGAHNPPAMRALVDSLKAERMGGTGFPFGGTAICGFCGDKDVAATLEMLHEIADVGLAVPIRNPRSMSPGDVAAMMRKAGFAEALPCQSLREALRVAPDGTLVCGSLFLAGETLELLGALPSASHGFTPNETMVVGRG